jgi:hypothetical protein
MGLFKSMKDMAELTKQGKELQKQQQEQAGYGPGFGGMMKQMGDMVSDANEQLKELSDNSGDRARILAEGAEGVGTIVGMGTPERGAQWFNLNIDLEINVSGRDPYRINQQYMVPASAQLGPGVQLPVKVDKSDPAKIAIDWNRAPGAPAEGQIRPAGGAQTTPPAAAASGGLAGGAAGWSRVAQGGDPVARLEKLAQLKESGALSDAEFEAQKAKILGE